MYSLGNCLQFLIVSSLLSFERIWAKLEHTESSYLPIEMF